MSNLFKTFVELRDAVHHYCDPQMTKEILDTGFSVDYQDQNGKTILMHAVQPDPYSDHNSPKGILDVVEVILQYGARIDLRSSEGKTACDYCSQNIDPLFRDECGYCPRNVFSPEDIELFEEIMECLLK